MNPPDQSQHQSMIFCGLPAVQVAFCSGMSVLLNLAVITEFSSTPFRDTFLNCKIEKNVTGIDGQQLPLPR